MVLETGVYCLSVPGTNGGSKMPLSSGPDRFPIAVELPDVRYWR